MILYIFYFI